ncbi:hypothetical protein LCM20_07530 [Halobacillus litoralis]|uniref:hypothetical protein n=1 Tax=Halobacillus litoralis TaxID=45668 RepID=UPI001CD5ED7A|nr:hypothetical protein [Halobacillus litoralis]MCA0970432.1 hypothetical protein [Halobacillus litoralis]
MENYINRIEELNITSNIARNREMISLIEEEKELEGQEQVLQRLERIKLVLDALESRINSANFILTPYDSVKTINDNLNNMYNQINGYKGNNQIANLTNANANCDTIIKLIQHFSIPHTIDDLEQFREHIHTVKRSISQHRANVTEDGEKVAGLKTTLESEITDLTQKLTSYEEEIRTLKENLPKQIEELLTTQKDVFITEKDKVLEEERESYIEQLGELVEKVDEQAGQTNKSLREKESELNELFEFVTDKTISGEFNKAAKDEDNARKMWTKITIGGFGALILYSVWVFFASEFFVETSTSFTMVEITKKLSITLGIGALITYSAKQAGDHKREARYNRNVQMKIQSINPYLQNYQDESPQEVKDMKLKLADHLFTKETAAATDNESTHQNNADNTQVPLQTILEIIKQSNNPK